jgi:hypothetical protein
MTDTATRFEAGFVAAVNILERTRAGLRLIVTGPNVKTQRSARAPEAGTHNTVEIRVDSTGAVVIAHGRNSTRILSQAQVPYPQCMLAEHDPFVAYLTQAVDDAWRLVVDTAVAS